MTGGMVARWQRAVPAWFMKHSKEPPKMIHEVLMSQLDITIGCASIRGALSSSAVGMSIKSQHVKQEHHGFFSGHVLEKSGNRKSENLKHHSLDKKLYHLVCKAVIYVVITHVGCFAESSSSLAQTTRPISVPYFAKGALTFICDAAAKYLFRCEFSSRDFLQSHLILAVICTLCDHAKRRPYKANFINGVPASIQIFAYVLVSGNSSWLGCPWKMMCPERWIATLVDLPAIVVRGSARWDFRVLYIDSQMPWRFRRMFPFINGNCRLRRVFVDDMYMVKRTKGLVTKWILFFTNCNTGFVHLFCDLVMASIAETAAF